MVLEVLGAKCIDLLRKYSNSNDMQWSHGLCRTRLNYHQPCVSLFPKVTLSKSFCLRLDSISLTSISPYMMNEG